MAGRRNQRVCELLKVELSRLIAREKRLEGYLITLIDISLAPDFKQATVYYSSLKPKLNIEETSKLLNELGHQWYRAIGQRVRMKYTPRLTFEYDTTIERGDRVLNILQQIRETTLGSKSDSDSDLNSDSSTDSDLASEINSPSKSNHEPL